MTPQLERYAVRIFSLLHNHWCIAESHFAVEEEHDVLRLAGHAQLIDGSILYIREVTKVETHRLNKTGTSYQFRHEGDDGVFRYDSASHGQAIPHHHKHTSAGRMTSPGELPRLLEVLKEVEDALTRELEPGDRDSSREESMHRRLAQFLNQMRKQRLSKRHLGKDLPH